MVKVVKFHVTALVLLYRMVLPVMVLVAVVGANPCAMSITPLLAQVRAPLPLLFNWPYENAGMVWAPAEVKSKTLEALTTGV